METAAVSGQGLYDSPATRTLYRRLIDLDVVRRVRGPGDREVSLCDAGHHPGHTRFAWVAISHDREIASVLRRDLRDFAAGVRDTFVPETEEEADVLAGLVVAWIDDGMVTVTVDRPATPALKGKL
jgi:hypothetical protein